MALPAVAQGIFKLNRAEEFSNRKGGFQSLLVLLKAEAQSRQLSPSPAVPFGEGRNKSVTPGVGLVWGLFFLLKSLCLQFAVFGSRESNA